MLKNYVRPDCRPELLSIQLFVSGFLVSINIFISPDTPASDIADHETEASEPAGMLHRESKI
jgi:hypothetical protein